MFRVTRRRWFLVLVCFWGVALVVLALVSHSDTTVAQQQSPAAARPTIDRGISAVLAAAGRSTVGAVGEYRLTEHCDLTAVRDGVRYTRTLDLYVAPGRGPAELDRIFRRLPGSFRAMRIPALTGPTPQILAHPDPFVRLTVSALDDDRGHLQAVADTGCRPTTGHPYPQFDRTAGQRRRDRVTEVFALFDVTPQHWRRVQLPCSTGSAVTVRASGVARESLSPLPATLHETPPPAAGRLLTGTDDRYVYRAGDRGLVVTEEADRLTVSVTTGCR